MTQLALIHETDSIEEEVQAILTRRRTMNASGQAGEDIDLIRVAIAASRASENGLGLAC